MKKCCANCGFFGARDHLRPELTKELAHAEMDGACLEQTNGLFFLPLISNSDTTHCHKWMEPVGLLPRKQIPSGNIIAFVADP